MIHLIDKENVLNYIPQRPPVVMVDKLISINESTQTALTGFFIREDSIFCENGFFKEPGLLENIAQSCALRAGYLFHSKNEPVPLGFIGAIKNLKIYFFPKIGTEIQTEIKLVNEIFDVALVHGKVISEGEMAAECEMKIVMKKG
jgi:3-hydroxymyristoyl/3-hydroxydecanoyl-(acyl carrier protein) dehydratase